MDDVVPAVLQRLRASDIIRMAGLNVAALGQEYSRLGHVHPRGRQGARLFGIVNAPDMAREQPEVAERLSAHQHNCFVDVELQTPTSWRVHCTCTPGQTPGTCCSHTAALLYHWLANPLSFAISSSGASPIATADELNSTPPAERPEGGQRERQTSMPVRVSLLRGPMPLGSIGDILALLPLNELRVIAREYEVVTTGLNKQQLSAAIQEAFTRPEAVARVVGTLERQQRQLLAALTLAGGSMTDDDLRGLFERFKLGFASQLQGILSVLQKKGLLFRTNLHGSSALRPGFSPSLLDVGLGWYVPLEVRAALHISIPITQFEVGAQGEDGASALQVELARSYWLLADLLLVACALEGVHVESAIGEIRGRREAAELFAPAHAALPDSSTPLPAPPGWSTSALIETLQQSVPRSPAFLRFAVRLLELSGMLYLENSDPPVYRVLNNAAHFLLGPGRVEVLRDLFGLWLTHASYDELFALQ